MLTIEPITQLHTDLVELVPLSIEHTEAFYAAGSDESLWRWVIPNQCTSLVTARDWIKQSLLKHEQGSIFLL